MITEIQQLVNLLSLPIRQETLQPASEDDPTVMRRVAYVPPLLQQLRDSVGGSGGYGRGGSEQRTRSVIDAAGLELYRNITTDISEMWQSVHPNRIPINDPELQLREWWTQYRPIITYADVPWARPERVRPVHARLAAWVRTIEAKFDPPRQKELLFPCPNLLEVPEGLAICGQRYYTNPEGDRSSALVALFPSRGGVSVTCRACGGYWRGEDGLYQLEAMKGSIV